MTSFAKGKPSETVGRKTNGANVFKGDEAGRAARGLGLAVNWEDNN